MTAAKSGGNRHKGTFVVRLPEEYREWVRAAAAASKRTISAEVQVALDAYRLAAAGPHALTAPPPGPPPKSPESGAAKGIPPAVDQKKRKK